LIRLSYATVPELATLRACTPIAYRACLSREQHRATNLGSRLA
jgi:hypothetical protein